MKQIKFLILSLSILIGFTSCVKEQFLDIKPFANINSPCQAWEDSLKNLYPYQWEGQWYGWQKFEWLQYQANVYHPVGDTTFNPNIRLILLPNAIGVYSYTNFGNQAQSWAGLWVAKDTFNCTSGARFFVSPKEITFKFYTPDPNYTDWADVKYGRGCK